MTTANRDFSVVRRRPHLVDIVVPRRTGVQGYRFSASTNFDLSFHTILTADISCGYIDSVAVRAGRIDPRTLGALSGKHVRIVFDPTTFATPHAAGLDDNQHIWLKFIPVDVSGVAGTPSAPVLVLPYDELNSQGRVIIKGDAPSGSTVANSLRIDLPNRMRNITVRNNSVSGGATLMLASTEGGPEYEVAPQEEIEFFEGNMFAFLVRGAGGVANFSASMTHYLPL